MKTDIYYLIGASGHGKVIAEILEVSAVQIGGFFDHDSTKKIILSYPVLDDFIKAKQLKECEFIISIGNNKIRKEIADSYNLPYGFAIHPASWLSNRTRMGKGTVIMAGVIVNSESVIGRHCILNTACSIDHDCQIGDFVHLSPGVRLAGNVIVGEGTHIGTGASVIPGIKIGKWCTIGAGAAIIKDVPDFATVVGVPGRVIKISDKL